MSQIPTTPIALETLLVEQARLLARQLQQVADQAPHGHVLAAVEAAAVPAARALARTAVEALLQQHAAAAEKRGHRTAAARPAGCRPGPSGTPPATS